MTPEQQRIALAEWAGWKWDSIPADGGCFGWVSPEGGFPQDGIESLPDYLSDLNAVRDLEQKLTNAQRRYYAKMLISVHPLHYDPIEASDDGYMKLFLIAHMDAAQRCEALLKTIGLWKEEP